MAENTVSVGVAGATGQVGAVIRTLLEQREFPVGNLHLLAGD